MDPALLAGDARHSLFALDLFTYLSLVVGTSRRGYRMDLRNWLTRGLLITDGAWGTELQRLGLSPGTIPDTWNVTHAERVAAVARSYADAGSEVILTNTFRANAIAMQGVPAGELDEINRAGVAISREAAGEARLKSSRPKPEGAGRPRGPSRDCEVTWAADLASLKS